MPILEMNKWFSLPRVGAESFAELKRAGVVYETKFGFKFTSQTNVKRALSELSNTLGEEFQLQTSCFICGGPIEGNELNGLTLCQICARSDEAYALYTMKFAQLMGTI